MKVVREPVLAQRTTLRIGGKAVAEVVLEREEDVHDLADRLERLGGAALVLGEGSNILAADESLPYVLVRLDTGRQPEIVREENASILISVPGEMRLPRLLGWCARRGFCGLEPLTGIPGSLGGAVAMNAGSYGLELSQVLERVLVWTASGGCVWSEKGQWRSGYRHFESGLNDRLQLFLAAQLRVQKAPPDQIRNTMRHWYARKKETQPVTMDSAGCVFKNPSLEQPAGKLLDQAGLRGYRLGRMAFSERHANFMVNLGGGRSLEAFELLELAKDRVGTRFGLKLTEEVRIIA